MICEGVNWVKRCNQCTSICYGVPLDENGLCPGGKKECYHQPPRCERVCDEKSCNFVPIPLCNEVRVAKNVSLNFFFCLFNEILNFLLLLMKYFLSLMSHMD